MRVLIVSWEYPPVVVGGLGRHVHALATGLAAAGHEVTVVTRDGADAPLDEVRDGVRIVRTPEDPPRFSFFSDLLAWTMAFNHALVRACADVVREWQPDVVHAHDWLVAHAAIAVGQLTGAPLVTTFHATEAGRHRGWLPDQLSRSIYSVEWWLVAESARLIVCSEYMRDEVTRLFDVPDARCDVIPNGVDAAAIGSLARDRAEAGARDRAEAGARGRAEAGARDHAEAGARGPAGRPGPRVAFVGRLVYEKGAQDLLSAVPRLKRRYPGLHVDVVGAGPYDQDLHALAARLRLGRTVTFHGFLPDTATIATMAAADCVVVPSYYEPFGMVALEAAAAGSPLVVSDVGGLREFVAPGVTGLTFPREDVPALAEAVFAVLGDEALARRLARAAGERLTSAYTWPAITERTVSTYRRAVEDNVGRARRSEVRSRPPMAPEYRSVNLFTGEPG